MKNTTISNKIRCLLRLREFKPSLFIDMRDFLVGNKLVNADSISTTNPTECATQLFIAINKLLEEDKVSLFDFSWQVLPTEIIKVSILTDRELREFSNLE
jgi:hypothetical protein